MGLGIGGGQGGKGEVGRLGSRGGLASRGNLVSANVLLDPRSTGDASRVGGMEWTLMSPRLRL